MNPTVVSTSSGVLLPYVIILLRNSLHFRSKYLLTMVFFDSLVGFVREKVLGGVKEAVINNLPVENKYGEFGSQGKILSWVESLPVVGKILENLGPNRKQLYKIIIETKPVENLVGTVLFRAFHCLPIVSLEE